MSIAQAPPSHVPSMWAGKGHESFSDPGLPPQLALTPQSCSSGCWLPSHQLALMFTPAKGTPVLTPLQVPSADSVVVQVSPGAALAGGGPHEAEPDICWSAVW